MVIMTTVSGSQAITEIDRAVANLRNEESRLTTELAGPNDAIARARASEAKALSDLARFRLSTDADAVAARLDQASREATDFIAARSIAWAALEKERNAAAKSLTRGQTKLDRFRAELDAVEDRIEALTEPLKAALAADPKHVALIAAAEEADKVAEAAAAKAEQAETDRTTKTVAYEKDPLFMYLWRRGFGTPAYRYSGLTRTLDRWVSNLIGYLEARPSFKLLNEIPDRLTAHAKRVAEEADAADVAVEASEDAALAKLAGEDLAAKERQLQQAVAGEEAALEPQRKVVEGLDSRAATFALGEDQHFKGAIEALSRSLAHEDIAKLRDEARATSSPDDERYVGALEAARTEIARLQPVVDKLKGELAGIAKRREELGGVANDFRSRGWTNRSHSFSFGDLLTGYLLGRVTRGGLWGGIESSHRGTTYSGGFGSPGGFRGPSIRIGGGGFRTGRSFGGGGGGFRTGRRF